MVVSYTRSNEQKNHEMSCGGAFLCSAARVHGQGKPNKLHIYLISEDSRFNQEWSMEAVLEAAQ